MINATVIQTNSQPVVFTFKSLLWAECIKEIGGLPTNTVATLVRVAGTNQGRNLRLSPDSILPAGGSSYLIALTQEKMSGALVLDFEADDVSAMSHRELIMTCRDLRVSDNDKVQNIIGNYTHDTTNDLRNKLYEVIKQVGSETPTQSEVTREEMDSLSQRVLEIESYLLIPSKEFLASL